MEKYNGTALLVPLATKFARKGLFVGVRQQVSAQVLLVLGGKAAAEALVGPQVRVQLRVSLKPTNTQ